LECVFGILNAWMFFKLEPCLYDTQKHILILEAHILFNKSLNRVEVGNRNVKVSS